MCNTLREEFTCQICIEPTSERFKNADMCSHDFCTGCLIQYIRVKLEQNDAVKTIPCPALNCDHALDPITCASVIGDAMFVRWCDALCQSTILGINRCYCPYRSCNVLILNECGNNVKKSSCPKCRRLFCFECKRAWHAGFRCDESAELVDANDVAFGRLVEQRKWMRCPSCRHFVERIEGCLMVTCRCGIHFCYMCGKQANNGMHLCRFPVGMCTLCCTACICCCIYFLLFGFVMCLLDIL